MYPQTTNNSPSTSTPKPKSISETNPTGKQSTESSPQSSLRCGQRTPTSSNVPSSHTPPQPFVHTQHTSPKPHRQQTRHTPVNTTNQPTQPHISGEEQCIPKSTDGSQVKSSKQQPRQQNGCLCFYCNQAGHIKRDCPEIPYCSRCRTRGHPSDKCTSKPQRSRYTHQHGESREQPKRNEDLPKFSNQWNMCLHCAGDHQTATCTMTWQQQTTNTNTGTPIHQNSPNTPQSSSSSSHSQTSRPHSQSTLHVQTPTLNINAPHSRLTCIKPLHLHSHRITLALITTRINNIRTHHQHNPWMHNFHNLSILMFPHHTFLSIHLLTIHQHIVLTLQSY